MKAVSSVGVLTDTPSHVIGPTLTVGLIAVGGIILTSAWFQVIVKLVLMENVEDLNFGTTIFEIPCKNHNH